jgi:catechol 2,3-dioxygenase-like lactoylglutathione lyase family enzyme
MSGLVPQLHHVAVQTSDLANCVDWYVDFFGGRATWSTEDFSDLTRGRLTDICEMTEVAVGGMQFHLFERDGADEGQPHANRAQFQHVCLEAGSAAELREWRERWLALHDSGKYRFSRPDGPTDVVVDDQGTESFYFFDVNGLEFELTYLPGSSR